MKFEVVLNHPVANMLDEIIFDVKVEKSYVDVICCELKDVWSFINKIVSFY